LIHQVFHALPEMTSPQGEPVGAVFGFARDLFYLLEQKRPDYLFCAFDLPGKTFRHQLYEQYKGHRPEMDVDLAPQFGNIRKVVEAMGIPALGLESFEADDVLATVARLTGERGGQCFLVTADKDCRQLITDQVLVYNIRKDQVIDREALKADWGIAPEQVIDFQALVGDSVDNVPGVPLIGPKGAQQLLQHFGTLDALYQRIDELPNGKKKQNLIAAHDQALLSRNLVRLDCQVPVPVDWEAGRVGRIDRPRLRELFQRFGFRSLVEKVDALASQFGEAAPAGKSNSVIAWSTRPRPWPPWSRSLVNKRACRSTWRQPISGRGGPRSSELPWPGTTRKDAICPFVGRPAKNISTSRQRWTPCVRSWKTRRSRRSART
jgi:DNA polymerase-1